MEENLEIERRFFVDGRGIKTWHSCESKSKIMQFYIDNSEINILDGVLRYGTIPLVSSIAASDILLEEGEWTARIRYSDSSTLLTMKGPRVRATAVELEWQIERARGEEVFRLGDFPSIKKTRYNWRANDGMLWEVDEFEGVLSGLVLAEVELQSEETPIEIPSWVGREITGEGSLSNAALAHITNLNQLEMFSELR